MTKIRASITAVNGWVPEYILSNEELEKLVDTNDEWITSRTGIKERRILKGEGLGTSDIGVKAIEGLLKKRGIGAEEIELIICATTKPEFADRALGQIVGLRDSAEQVRVTGAERARRKLHRGRDEVQVRVQHAEVLQLQRERHALVLPAGARKA